MPKDSIACAIASSSPLDISRPSSKPMPRLLPSIGTDSAPQASPARSPSLSPLSRLSMPSLGPATSNDMTESVESSDAANDPPGV